MKGLLINYEYCSGCHSCEVACRKHLGLGEGEFGIKLTEVGPFEYQDAPASVGKERWEWVHMPIITKACTMCADRTAQGKLPMCVQHCQAFCMQYGEVADLVAEMDGSSRYALLTR